MDVVTYDISDIKNNVEALNSEMAETKNITKNLEEDVKKARIVAYTALAFSGAKTVTNIAKIGVQIASKGISLAGSATTSQMSLMNSLCSEAGEMELADIGADPFMYSLRSIKTDLTPLLTWCEEEYKSLPDIIYDEERNLKTTIVSLHTTREICNRFRESLKPYFKSLANRINEINEDTSNLDTIYATKDEVSNCVSKEKFNTKIQEYISKDELTREDKIDIIIDINKEHHVLELQLEDSISNGLIIFKTFIQNSTQKKFYIKIEDIRIIEYKGVSNEITINGVTIQPLENSEEDRINYMPNAELILDNSDKVILIPYDENYKLTGAVISLCTCGRQMVFTPNDFAYTCDIEALDKKITALAEISHTNDTLMLSFNETPIIDTSQFITKEESDNKYVLKNDIIESNIITQPLSLYIDEDGYYRIKNFNKEFSNILRESTINIEATFTENDISGSYKFIENRDDLFVYKKTLEDTNELNILYRYYSGSITYNENKNISISSITYSHKVEKFNDNNIYSVKMVDEKFISKDDASKNWNLYYSTFNRLDLDTLENLIALHYDSNTKILTYIGVSISS